MGWAVNTVMQQHSSPGHRWHATTWLCMLYLYLLPLPLYADPVKDWTQECLRGCVLYKWAENIPVCWINAVRESLCAFPVFTCKFVQTLGCVSMLPTLPSANGQVVWVCVCIFCSSLRPHLQSVPCPGRESSTGKNVLRASIPLIHHNKQLATVNTWLKAD